MALISKSTVVYTLITIIIAIIYPFLEWRLSLSQYNEKRIDKDFNRQLYRVIHYASSYSNSTRRIQSTKIHKLNRHKKLVPFKLIDAQYSSILSNYIYLITHNTFKSSRNPLIRESLSLSPHNFPNGFNLYYLQLRTENDVNIKWGIIENNITNTLYLILCGTDSLVDALIDISFTVKPLIFTSNDILSSKSWSSILNIGSTHTSTQQHDNYLVHGAIGGNIQWLYSNITNILHSILNKYTYLNNKRLILCGHSLGAGYATILTMHLLSSKNQINMKLNLFTFGAPSTLAGRIHDDFSGHPQLKILNKITFNFINRFDLVPRLLGKQFESLYPAFIGRDELLLNQIGLFRPIGNYFILHDRNRIVTDIDHHTLSNQLLHIVPKAILSDNNDARTKLVLFIFRFLFGKQNEDIINYLLWLSFSSYPLLNDHSMDKYLSAIGTFSSKISFINNNNVFCLNSRLRFEECLNVRKTRDIEWRITFNGQLQNIRTKECLYINWKLDYFNSISTLSFIFKYSLSKTYECSTHFTKFKYLNNYKLLKIISDERIENYDDTDIDLNQLIHVQNNNSVNETGITGLCLGCNLTTYKLTVYQCNQIKNDGLANIEFYFNPNKLASNSFQNETEINNKIEPTWSWWSFFDEYF